MTRENSDLPVKMVILWDSTRENGDLTRENRDLTRENGDLTQDFLGYIMVIFG